MSDRAWKPGSPSAQSEPSRQRSEPENKEIKWTTLEHAGVLFPPEYTPLPDDVKLLYEGKPVNLTPAQVGPSCSRTRTLLDGSLHTLAQLQAEGVGC